MSDHPAPDVEAQAREIVRSWSIACPRAGGCSCADGTECQFQVDAIAQALTAAQDKIKQVEAELAAERAYTAEATKAITNLTGGGSENFIRRGDRYLADLPFCVQRIRDRFTSYHEMLLKAVCERKAAEAAAQDKIKQVEGERDEWSKVIIRVIEANPGFDWRDYPDGITADEAAQFFSDDIHAAWEQTEQLTKRALAAEAAALSARREAWEEAAKMATDEAVKDREEATASAADMDFTRANHFNARGDALEDLVDAIRAFSAHPADLGRVAEASQTPNLPHRGDHD